MLITHMSAHLQESWHGGQHNQNFFSPTLEQKTQKVLILIIVLTQTQAENE